LDTMKSGVKSHTVVIGGERKLGGHRLGLGTGGGQSIKMMETQKKKGGKVIKGGVEKNVQTGKKKTEEIRAGTTPKGEHRIECAHAQKKKKAIAD